MPGHRFLVVVHSDATSRHVEWIGDAQARFDLAAHPRTDETGYGKWATLAALLSLTAEQWASYDYVFLPDADLEASSDEINRLFDAAAAHRLALCQPSLGWRSHFRHPVSLHNPSFTLRQVNSIDLAAACFDATFLRSVLPMLALDPHGQVLGRVLPQMLRAAKQPCAVIDAVQVFRTSEPLDRTLEHTAAELLSRFTLRDDEISYGGIGARGQRVSLFDSTREECLGLLVTGYACAVQEPAPLGEVFLQHFLLSLDDVEAATAYAGANAVPASPAQPPSGALRPGLRASPVMEAAR